jgi:hypothetical protein
MSRVLDRNRILGILGETDGLSNLRIKTELNLTDQRYAQVREELLNEGLVEKYVCRGGGIKLTRAGEKKVPTYNASSKVKNEEALYEPLVKFLEKQAEEDEVQALVWDTHRWKARGQWQNPDVTRVTVEHYPHLGKSPRVLVTTYEVKQFPRWNVDAVYEAASHNRFSHEAWVVLEWPKEIEFSPTNSTYRLDQLARECSRFGVGLATLQPYYSSSRLHVRLEPNPQKIPSDEDLDRWFEHIFSRSKEALNSYRQMLERQQNIGPGDETG